jgi:putative addiction module killer protein
MAVEVRQTDAFREWLRRLRDQRAKARIDARIRRLELGNPGDVRSLGGGLTEIRIDYGPGYRIYFTQQGSVVILLRDGDKRRQDRDIKQARKLLEQHHA